MEWFNFFYLSQVNDEVIPSLHAQVVQSRTKVLMEPVDGLCESGELCGVMQFGVVWCGVVWCCVV